MSRCSSLAITLMALISVSKSEWYPPQCAILRSPCSNSLEDKVSSAKACCQAGAMTTWRPLPDAPLVHRKDVSGLTSLFRRSSWRLEPLSGLQLCRGPERRGQAWLSSCRSVAALTANQCVSSSITLTPSCIWSVRLNHWSFVRRVPGSVACTSQPGGGSQRKQAPQDCTRQVAQFMTSEH